MKHSIMIQRLCLFLLVLVLAAPAWAQWTPPTVYEQQGYELFRSRWTVKFFGKNKPVRTLSQGKVEIEFSDCKTTSGTGNSAIYELAKGSTIKVKAIKGYAIRWIILRDTEGGEDYDDDDGIKRISSVEEDYDYYFEKNAITNSHISEGNKDNLNDDDNNIVVYDYDASAQCVEIRTHNNKDWGQFKVRDIIVGYVNSYPAHFQKPVYDEILNRDFTIRAWGHNKGKLLPLDPNIVEFEQRGDEVWRGHPKAKGTTEVTVWFHADAAYDKQKCKAVVTVRDAIRSLSPDRSILFTEGGGDQPRSIYDIIKFSTYSGVPFDRNNPDFSIKSDNPDIVDITDKKTGNLVFSGKQGRASFTLTQGQNADYAGSSNTVTFTVLRGSKAADAMYIRNLEEWKYFAHLVNEEKMSNLNVKLDGDINLGKEIVKVGINGIVNYSGTLDGQGHTISFDWNSTEKFAAPFDIMSGATIKNLHIKGQITNNVEWAAGLVVSVVGSATTTISNCVSEVDFKNSLNDDCVVSGFVNAVRNSTLVINDCLYKGKIREFGIRFMQTVAIALTPLYAQAVPLACSQRNNTQPMPSTGS